MQCIIYFINGRTFWYVILLALLGAYVLLKADGKKESFKQHSVIGKAGFVLAALVLFCTVAGGIIKVINV